MKDVQETLDRLVPTPARKPDWGSVLRDARPRRRSLAVQLTLATGVAAASAPASSTAHWLRPATARFCMSSSAEGGEGRSST